MREMTLADGQLAASAATILAGSSVPPGARVAGTFQNTGGNAETVVLTFQRAGGTARRVARFVLQTNEQAVVRGLGMQPDDTLLGTTTNATAVDYVLSACGDLPLEIVGFDANGALKSGAAAIGSGNLTITGDLTVSGGDIDAGASGTAGTVDVFPSTGSKGKLAISCTDQTGDTTVALVAGAMAAARTITLADPLAAANIMLGIQSSTARTATADGLTTGTIADGGYWQFVTVTSADANNIVVLPTPTPGKVVVLRNGATGYELRTSDPATIAINGGAGASAESAIAASTCVLAICTSATTWQALSLVGTTLAAVEAAA